MSIPYEKKASRSHFFVPKTLESDFDTFLENDIPDVVGDFTAYRDWFARLEEDYEPYVIRGEIYPDTTKSRYEDTDNNLNIRFSKSADILKGDYIEDSHGVIYLLDWEIAPESNNKASRAVRCNLNMEVRRFRNNPINADGDVLVDEMGYVIETPSTPEDTVDYDVIVPGVPVNAYHYDGRPEYSVIAASPGVVPNNLVILNVQYNSHTANIKLDDYFHWGDSDYVIMDVNYVGMNMFSNTGVLKIQAKKKAGTEQ